MGVDGGGHHVEGAEGASHEFEAGDLSELRVAEVSEDEQHEADGEQEKGEGHGTVDSHGGDEHDEGVDGEGDEEPADVGTAGGIDFKLVAEENDGEGDPERTVSGERAVAEVVAAFELLEAGDELCKSAEDDGDCEDGAHFAPADIVELQQQCGNSKPGESYYGWVSLCICSF